MSARIAANRGRSIANRQGTTRVSSSCLIIRFLLCVGAFWGGRPGFPRYRLAEHAEALEAGNRKTRLRPARYRPAGQR